MAQKNLEISVLCDIYWGLLPEKQRLALDYYYNEDLSLAEISEHAGISRQGVRDQIKHAEAQLYELENALGLYRKSVETEKIISELEDLNGQINNSSLTSIIGRLRAINE